MKNMENIGIRALKQNASAVIAQVVAGDTVTVTDRGRPVAQIGRVADSPLERLLASGRARPAKRDIRQLSAAEPGPSVSEALAVMRDSERR
jgi:prevent-host-death family protein